MTFKKNWEKTDQQVDIETTTIHAMVDFAFPKNNLRSFEVISGGCANLNIKFNLENKKNPFILRVFLRDQAAAYRERKLASLLKDRIAVPEVYFVGDVNSYRFSITQFIHGITLRDLLLNDYKIDMGSIMEEVGLILAKIQSYQFSCSCFFDDDLSIKRKLTRDDYLNFAKECLVHTTTVNQLPKGSISKINSYLEKYGQLFPDEHERNLVHGDYDPANILVKEIGGRWTVSGVLDWEFAFSGSTLCDIANMLRYAHQMPSSYETSFLDGLKNGGMELHQNWHISICMLNMSSLLDCLIRCPPNIRPNQCNDISELIDYILKKLDEL